MRIVSEEYLAKVRFAVRRSAGNSDVDDEIEGLIAAARMDMSYKGVPLCLVTSESSSMVLGCIRCYVRWQFGINGDDADRNRDAYDTMVEQLRKAAPRQ